MPLYGISLPQVAASSAAAHRLRWPSYCSTHDHLSADEPFNHRAWLIQVFGRLIKRHLEISNSFPIFTEVSCKTPVWLGGVFYAPQMPLSANTKGKGIGNFLNDKGFCRKFFN